MVPAENIGERMLWSNALHMAYLDAMGHKGVKEDDQKKARVFFRNASARYCWICHTLSINPQVLRKHVLHKIGEL